MTKEKFIEAMRLLDIIEDEFNKIAAVVGHCSFSEFMDKEPPILSDAMTQA